MIKIMTNKKDSEFFFYKRYSEEIKGFDIEEKWDKILKLNLYLDCMPLDGLPGLSDGQKNNLRVLATRNEKLIYADEEISKVNYKFCILVCN